jgi:aryl-alcohol dehydrogenase-like predicted oxidoreductase
MNFGPLTTEEDSFAIMDKALDLGINFFDIANVYGWKKGEGVTEQIIGNWFAKGGGRREKTVIATKVYGDMGDWPNDNRLSALSIRRQCEASLKRMQTDYIDLYQMHHIWREAPVEEIFQAFELLVQQGKVLYFGSSNFSGWHIAQYSERAKQRGFLGLISEQCKYSLDSRAVETDVLPAAQHYGLGVIPWSPLGGGILGGILQKAKEGRSAGEHTQNALEKKRPQVEKWEGYCKELGEKPADLALAWLLSNPAVTAPIIGPRTMEQLEGSIRATEIKITDEIKAKLDEIFPGHKTAPEDFAW